MHILLKQVFFLREEDDHRADDAPLGTQRHASERLEPGGNDVPAEEARLRGQVTHHDRLRLGGEATDDAKGGPMDSVLFDVIKGKRTKEAGVA